MDEADRFFVGRGHAFGPDANEIGNLGLLLGGQLEPLGEVRFGENGKSNAPGSDFRQLLALRGAQQLHQLLFRLPPKRGQPFLPLRGRNVSEFPGQLEGEVFSGVEQLPQGSFLFRVEFQLSDNVVFHS